MDFVLIVDTETTGVDHHKDRCIEVAAVQYSLAHRCVVQCFSQLINAGPNDAESINHIPSGALEWGDPADQVWQRVERMAHECDAILAHNASFDRRWVPAHVTGDIPWICTYHGIEWPISGDARNLIAIALAHGLGVVDPHRALSDCMLIARLLHRCAELGHDVAEMLSQGLRPQAHFQALVTFDGKEAAKAKGFQWDAKGRRWVRAMAIEDATREKLGFDVRRCAETIEV